MDWSDLRVFLAVAQTGSLRQAAAKLGVTQPTVSRRLQNLEAAFGVPLFERSREGHRLTPAGADLLPDVRAVESAALRLEQRSTRLTSQFAETVRVGAGETAATVLARGLDRLSGGPALELVVVDKPSVLETRKPDILVLHGLPRAETGQARRVGSVDCAVYGVEAFADGYSLPLTTDELATLPWLGFVEEQEHYVTMKWLRDVMRERPPAARLMNVDLMAAAAETGVGVAVLPCFKGDGNPGLVRLTQKVDALRADYWRIIQADLARNMSVRVVADWIVTCFAEIERVPAQEQA